MPCGKLYSKGVRSGDQNCFVEMWGLLKAIRFLQDYRRAFKEIQTLLGRQTTCATQNSDTEIMWNFTFNTSKACYTLYGTFYVLYHKSEFGDASEQMSLSETKWNNVKSVICFLDPQVNCPWRSAAATVSLWKSSVLPMSPWGRIVCPRSRKRLLVIRFLCWELAEQGGKRKPCWQLVKYKEGVFSPHCTLAAGLDSSVTFSWRWPSWSQITHKIYSHC